MGHNTPKVVQRNRKQGDKTFNVLKDGIKISVILDHPVESDDTFELVSDDGTYEKPPLHSSAAAKLVAGEGILWFDGIDSEKSYKLFHHRSTGSKRVLFDKWTKFNDLKKPGVGTYDESKYTYVTLSIQVPKKLPDEYHTDRPVDPDLVQDSPVLLDLIVEDPDLEKSPGGHVDKDVFAAMPVQAHLSTEDNKKLTDEYDGAIAVFSRSFRFVEWKFIIAAPYITTSSGIWARDPKLNYFESMAFGDDIEPVRKTVKEKFDREKWIYVFWHNAHEKGAYAEIREEIQIDANGNMKATPYDEINKKLKDRGKPVALGTTMCLPRRVFGTPKVYRFYASRVRLEHAQIKELEEKIHWFAPATNLEPGNNNTSVLEMDEDGTLLVPVVDPLTVALHLHAAFVAAANDVINYTIPHKDLNPVDRKQVERRRKKQALAKILKDIIGDKKDESTETSKLVHALKNEQGPLEDFLTHYEQEVQIRVHRRDQLGHYLVRWLISDAMRIPYAAHISSPKDWWVRFLVPWCHVITRLGETPLGLDYLGNLMTHDNGHFVHTYVWPRKELTPDQRESVHKGGLAILEAWKTIAELKILRFAGTYYEETQETIRRLYGLKEALRGKPLTMASIAKGVWISSDIDKEIALQRAVYGFDLKEIEDESKHFFAGGTRKVIFIFEAVNFFLAVSYLFDLYGHENATEEEKHLARISVIRSALEGGAGALQLAKDVEKFEPWVNVLGFLAGVLEVYEGVTEMNEAYKLGDQTIAKASFVTAVGATISTSASFLGFIGMPGVGIVAVVGLAVIAGGSIVKTLWHEEPIQKFFLNCSWGEKHLKNPEEKPEWSPTALGLWKGEKEFDYQLEALLNILCEFEISNYYDGAFRSILFKMRWVPPNTKLWVAYAEEWVAQPHYELNGTVEFTDEGLKTDQQGLWADKHGENGVLVLISDEKPGLPTPAPHHGLKVPGLRRSYAAGRLHITVGNDTVRVPHEKPVETTLYKT